MLVEPIQKHIVHTRLPPVSARPESLDDLGVMPERHRHFRTIDLGTTDTSFHLRELGTSRFKCIRVSSNSALNLGFFCRRVTDQFRLLAHIVRSLGCWLYAQILGSRTASKSAVSSQRNGVWRPMHQICQTARAGSLKVEIGCRGAIARMTPGSDRRPLPPSPLIQPSIYIAYDLVVTA